jgi:hypothetical protein
MYGFKEWDITCCALECGWQSLVLRAGGIHDVAKWHEDLPERFFLMPNTYHEALESVRRVPPGFDAVKSNPLQPRRQIRSWAEVMHVVRIEDYAVLEQLEPFHILNSEVVEKRFHQNDPAALWLLLLRVYVLPQRWNLPDDPEFGGCRSLIKLPRAPFPLMGKPVLEDAAFVELQEKLDTVLLSR